MLKVSLVSRLILMLNITYSLFFFFFFNQIVAKMADEDDPPPFMCMTTVTYLKVTKITPFIV